MKINNFQFTTHNIQHFINTFLVGVGVGVGVEVGVRVRVRVRVRVGIKVRVRIEEKEGGRIEGCSNPILILIL